jgi:hypothetical protein
MILSVGAFATPLPDYYFVSTTINGAQTQLDVNHSSIWFFSPTVDFNLLGGSFVMKDGPATNATISLTLYQGTPATGTTLREITLNNTPFTQSFSRVDFFFSSFATLSTAQQYTLVLHSSAPDQQNAAYFIKGAKDVGFSTTPTGTPDPVTGPITNTIGDPIQASVPEPSTYLLTSSAFLLFGGIRAIRRRRAKA